MEVPGQRVGRVWRKQKSRDESRLVQSDWGNRRAGEVRRLLVVARGNDCLIVQRKRDLVEIVPRVGRVIANLGGVFFHFVGRYAVDTIEAL